MYVNILYKYSCIYISVYIHPYLYVYVGIKESADRIERIENEKKKKLKIEEAKMKKEVL
jgi:hypothetical protein